MIAAYSYVPSQNGVDAWHLKCNFCIQASLYFGGEHSRHDERPTIGFMQPLVHCLSVLSVLCEENMKLTTHVYTVMKLIMGRDLSSGILYTFTTFCLEP
jgi:hypothetical protein